VRQFLLVIVLVGAAFAGGAVVSGPGFRWAQEHLLDYMGLKDGGEIDALDLTSPQAATDPDAPPAPSGPLVGQAAVAAKSGPSQAKAATPLPAPAPPPTPTQPFQETQAAASAAPAPPPETPPVVDPPKAEPPALLGALTSMLSPEPSAAAPAPAGSPAPEAAPAPSTLDPGVAPSALPGAELAPSPTAGTAGDWSEVRRKLTAAGVTRYTIEGEPGGRVVFSCLIPLAGKQAVSQRFEAEGDDEFQAAQAVLKRINLWRASQPVAPAAS